MNQRRQIEVCAECGADQDPQTVKVVYLVTVQKLEPQGNSPSVGLVFDDMTQRAGRIICQRCIGSDVLRRFVTDN